MMSSATLLDYGVGNIHSLTKALEASGLAVTVTDEPRDLLKAKVVVLPGVGAFGPVVEKLKPVRAALRDKLVAGTPCLAVCVGMQALFEESEESPGKGLGLLPGAVRRLRHQVLPHVGWNTLKVAADPLFEGLPTPPQVYFVHSFAPSSCGDGRIATAHYGDEFAAAVRVGATVGVQFHPEKSSATGLALLRNFVKELHG